MAMRKQDALWAESLGAAWGIAPMGPVLLKMIRAAVRAALPGRQQQKNLDPAMEAAVKAALRVARRRY